MKQLFRPLQLIAITGAVLVLFGCDTMERVPFTAPMKISKPQDGAGVTEISQAKASGKRDTLTSEPGPMPVGGRRSAEPIVASTPPKLTGEPVGAKYEGIRLPAFINDVFGNILKVPFDIDSSLAQKDSIMVTLSTGDTPLSRENFYQMVTEVLGTYGVSVIYSNNVYRIVEAANVKQPIPHIIRSRANTSIPADMRPVFVFQQINNVPTTSMTIWLNLALRDRVQIVGIPQANGLLLLGSADDVNSAIAIIESLDQPYMAGNRSLKISPAFWSAQRLSSQLVDILTAEGYGVGIGGANGAAIKLIPVEALNVIIAFGTSEETLRHVLQWATELDQPSQTVGSQGAYYQQVYNAKAKDLADTIKGLVETTVTTTAADQLQKGSAATTSSTKQRIMVDEPRNGIIFVGTAEEFAQFRSLMQQMDRAPLEVMIEATVAEVTLKQDENLGVVFNFNDAVARAPNSLAVQSTDGGLFFNLVRDKGMITSTINALADQNRVQILSSPRVVTSSGKPASINVGTQVPIITSQETAAGQVQGTTSILQSIQYRNTGVILNIQPTINSNRRVELNITQEVSDAQANNTSGIQSPIILTRSLTTTMSMNDGETVLLGGLISENYSTGDSGIPYLKDIPVLGNLFKTQSRGINRTELIVLLTPYIIDSSETARQIRDAFRSKLGDWATDKSDTAAPGKKSIPLPDTMPNAAPPAAAKP